MLLAVVFPLMLLFAALYLQSTLCVTIALFTWIGSAVLMLYLPFGARRQDL